MTMKTTISKCFDFDAAHRLPHVPDGHKCGRMHGHTYRVELILEGFPRARDGWFVDYADIAAAWAPLHALLDHRVLNDIDGLENPTTEVLAAFIWNRLTSGTKTMGEQDVAVLLKTVRIYESSTTYCEVSG